MNKYIKYIIILVIPLFVLTEALAKANDVKVPPKKVTLGDLLRRTQDESRGSKALQIEKKSVVVPDAQLTFTEKKDVNFADVKPPRMSEIYSYGSGNQVEYEKTLNLQIAELYKLTQKFGTSSNRGELWLRLAELYVEKAEIVDKRIQDTYDAKLKEFLAGKSKIKPVFDMKEAREYNKKAVALYEWFLKDFPKDSKIAQALFFLGYNNFELGNVKEGAAYYEQLTTRFPNSQFAGEAYFANGEVYFESEKWADAYKQYSFLIKNKKHSLHAIALYKASWCLFRLGKTEEGIKYLDYIIRSGRSAEMANASGRKKVNRLRLENEAIKDLIVFFSDVGDVKRAITYYTSLNTKESLSAIEKMAYYLSNKGEQNSARYIFNYLITNEPMSKKAFEFQYQIVQGYFFSKNQVEFKVELYKWIKNYNNKSSWYAAQKSDESFMKANDQLREKTLRNYILQQHQTAQNSHAESSIQAADQGYKLYFQEFTDFPDAGDMHFFYGELLYELRRFGDAVNEYMVIVSKHPDNKYIEKAAQNALLALEKVMPSDEDLQKRLGDSIEPMVLDEKINQFITTANWYITKYPKSDKAPEIKFRVGRLYYLTNNFDLAEKQFKEIVHFYPKTKLSEYSANLLLDIYSLKKDYVGLEKIGGELLANESIANSKVGEDIRQVLEKASFKRAQDLETDKKYFESAIQYQNFANQNIKSILVGVAFFNAAVNFERAGKNKDAISNYKKMLSSNSPNLEKLKPKGKRFLAKLYQDAGFFEESARYYSELIKDGPQDPLYTNYLYNLAIMKEILGRKTDAVADYHNYLKVNKNKEENAAVVFKIAQLQREALRYRDALDSYKQYTELSAGTAEKKVEAHYWMYDISTRLNLRNDIIATEAMIKRLIGKLGGKKEANVYLAKIKLIQAKDLFSKLKSITIPADPAQQKNAVNKKLEMIRVLNEQLGNIIKLDSAEEIISALAILGESNAHMASAFSSVPVPASLNADQKKLYMAEIDKITSPFVAKADESYRLAVERGIDLQVYNESYTHSFIKMNAKYPQQFHYAGEISSQSKAIDWMDNND